MTAGNARTRGVNPSIASGACLFPESGDFESAGDSMISLMTTEEGGTKVILRRRFSKYSSQSFLNLIDIALQLDPDWVTRAHKLAAMQSLLRTTSLLI